MSVAITSSVSSVLTPPLGERGIGAIPAGGELVGEGHGVLVVVTPVVRPRRFLWRSGPLARSVDHRVRVDGGGRQRRVWWSMSSW